MTTNCSEKSCEGPGDLEDDEVSEVDTDDSDGEFDPLPDDDEDVVGQEPCSAESSSHPTNTAVGNQKKTAGP